MRFSYIANTKDGKTDRGTLEADKHDTAMIMLAHQNLHPLVLKAAKAKAMQLQLGKRVKTKQLVIFTRQLSTMVSAGVPLARSMALLESQADNKYFQQVIHNITKDIESGRPLAEAFVQYPNVFSDVYVSMVRAGEAAGILDEILKRLAAQTEKDASIKKKIKGAMAYPTVILSITVIAFFFIMIFLMPKLSKIIQNLAGPNTQLPIYTRILLGFSRLCVSSAIIHHIPLLGAVPIIKKMPNLMFFVVLFGIAGFYLLRYIKTPTGKYKFHSLLLKIPLVKTVVTKIAIARFARTFAALTAAGVGVLDALEITSSAIGNKVIGAELQEAAKEVKNGKQLSEPLSRSQHFPPIVAQMLIVGEETGQIDTVLVKVAEFYEEEVDTVIESLSSIIEPLLIVVLGAAVGVIAASVMGPIANLNRTIGS
jgi:type IV pilus assembly protein PilC